MAVTYCNLTTDLTDAYSQIEDYKSYNTLSGWEVSAGNVYKKDQSGYIEMLFENGVKMTAGSDSSPTAGQFYYDSAADILYIQVADSGDPSTDTIEAGEDWTTYKTRCRNNAQEMIEAYLRSVYAVPFQKITEPDVSYNTRSYDYIVQRSTALLTCYLIITGRNVNDKAADMLYKQVYNNNPDIEEEVGIVQQILAGDLSLRTQKTARETGGYNMFEGGSNDGGGLMEVILPSGEHAVSTEQVWQVKCDLGGAPGTATFKLSYDQGGTFDLTGQDTRDSNADNQRVHLGSGVYVRFSGTLVADDLWNIHLYPATDVNTVATVKNIKAVR